MPDTLAQISSILTQPYGSMAYHLVVSFIFIGVLYPALVFSSEEQRTRRRMLIGIAGLLTSQLLIFLTSALVMAGFSVLSKALPVLDRVVTVIDIAIIIWLFAYVNSKARRVDFGLVAAILFLILGGGISVIYWLSSGAEGTFLQSELALIWNIAATFLTIAGQALVYRSGSKTRVWGQVMLLVITLGEILNLIPVEALSGDYSIILRLTYLVSFPLVYGISGSLQSQVTHTKMIVTSIPDNLRVPQTDQVDEPTVQEPYMVETEAAEPVRGIDMHLFQNTMSLAASSSVEEVSQLFTRYIAHALVSDICLLLSPPDDNGQVHLVSAYDLIVQESFSPFAFDHTLIPGYQEALETGRMLQVSDDTSEQIGLFAQLIMVEQIYSMLIYPLVGSEGQSIAAVCLVSPYSKYIWTEKEYSYLEESSSAMAAILEQVMIKDEGPFPAMETLTQQLEDSENERSRLAAEMEALSAELAALSIIAEESTQDDASLREAEAQLASLKSALEVLEEENNSLKEQITELSEENEAQIQQLAQLEADSAASPQELEDLSGKLQEALKRASNFESQLNQARAQLEFFDQSEAPISGSTLPTEQAEVIASIAQELRQPMSSISGYTDLLISESVGILGALQKKFLERVKASTDRMNHLIGDLIQITTLDSGNLAFTPQPVEVAEIVDAAIENTSGQFREKDIALRVDINPHLPKMHTDKDALQQILLHLLQNAGAATHEEGEIHVKIEPYNKLDSDIILISVTDSGEGIPREDLPRVFSRLYRADNPLIPGVGDTGVGLSIAKTLTEALGGRIWVESDQGVGSTFSVLLPVTTQIVDAVEG